MNILDDFKEISKIDRGKMVEKLKEAPFQYEKAWLEAEKIKFPANYRHIDKIVVCGMGGSAIGGDLAKDFCKIPFFVNRDYNLPEFIDNKTLLILVSYSGNTEEVLSSMEEGKKKKAKIFIISSGGSLIKRAENLKLPYYKINYFAPPRVALPYLFLPLIKILSEIGVLKSKIDIKKAIILLSTINKEVDVEISEKNNIAKSLAKKVYGRTPIVVASEKFKEIARRWKTQFNENAKNLSFFDVLPELKHNSIEGIDFPARNKENLFFFLIQSNLDSIQNKKSFEVLKEFMKKKRLKFESIFSRGEDLLSQKISLISLGDWLSFYLAILNKIDPTEIKEIKWFKEKLSE